MEKYLIIKKMLFYHLKSLFPIIVDVGSSLSKGQNNKIISSWSLIHW